MRNPFRIKNTIENEGWGLPADQAVIDFEEGDSLSPFQDRLEREGEGRIASFRLWALAVIVFGLIFARLYYLAVINHEQFLAMAEGNRLRIEYLPAPRGGVYDRRGELIAGNKPSFEVAAYPLDLPKEDDQYDTVVNKAADIIGMTPDEIKQILQDTEIQSYESVLIKQNVERDRALIFHEQAQNLPGFRIINASIRDYKQAEAFAHLLGFTGKINREEYKDKQDEGYLFNDSLGKTGLEFVYEKYLRGEFGEIQVEVDARGAVKRSFGEKQAGAGDNLILNIDAGLQEKLYESLKHWAGQKPAAAIAQDPRTGKILALVNLPSFDNNLFAEGISQADYQKLSEDKRRPLFNRAIAGTYPPGSTVKPMVALAALEEGVVTEKTVIEDRGYIVIENIYGGPDYFFYGYNRAGLGSMNVRSAIALSSDIYFYTVGGGYEPSGISGLGISKLAKYYQMFKIDQTLGIDLPGEKAGLVPTPEWKAERFAGDPVNSQWFLGNTYHVSIGQGDLLATPLHVLSWTAAIANGGKLWKPYIVERIENRDGEIIEKYETRMISELDIKKDYIRIVREGMRQTVTEGTARSLNTLSISAAGKTGTAQFDARNLNRTHAWFSAFAPFEDPEIAIVVLVEDGGEGSGSAVPVARDVLDWWARNRYNKGE